jgi:hypothetical protein
MSREPPSASDDIEIQTIHTYLYEGGVEPASTQPELGSDRLYRLMPPMVRTCLRAHDIVRKWLINSIAGLKLGVSVRQARIEKFLQAVEISRRYQSESDAADAYTRPCVRSFVESVLVGALLSPESRAHSKAWINVATDRGTSFDSLAALLHRPAAETPAKEMHLSVDIGWLFERLLEIISTPNVIDEGGRALVNFQKRR